MKRKKTKNFNYACPREFTTGRWRVHLVYPGEPRADGGLPKSENENPPCGDTMVEFYDTEDNGQFVASFHMNTLLGYPWNGMVGADLDGLEAYRGLGVQPERPGNRRNARGKPRAQGFGARP